MTSKRFRFSIRQILVLTAVVAASTALVVSFGNHFLWASRHLVLQRYPALAETDSRMVDSDCELSNCVFNGLSFDLPTSMLSTAKIVRTSATDVWLAFEDATRVLQISLLPTDMRTAMASLPSELNDFSSPKLLELSASTATDDFSFAMSQDELRIHDWAIETRKRLNFDDQNMNRYSRIFSDDVDAILISADPASIDSSRRLRSIFVWESTDRRNFGSIWFGDSRNVDAGWIDAVASSVAIAPGDRMTPTELVRLNDSEILSRLHVSDPQTK
jgi:hypothetical protein